MGRRVKDDQKLHVYEWEEDLHDEVYEDASPPCLTISDCQWLVDRTCIQWGVLSPRVEDGRGRKTACSTPEKICLPRLYREPISIIHEACHSIQFHISGDDDAAHGSLFVRLCIENYTSHFNLVRRELEETARSFGLSIAPRSSCPRLPDRQILRLRRMTDKLLVHSSNIAHHRDLLKSEIKQSQESVERFRETVREIQVERYG